MIAVIAVGTAITGGAAESIFAMTARALRVAGAACAVALVELALTLWIAVGVGIALGVGSAACRTLRWCLGNDTAAHKAWVGTTCIGYR